MPVELSQSDQERLSAWMDGELTPDEAEIVARRVETDTAWSEAHKQLQSLDATLSQWQAPPPPADLAERVLSHARRKPEPVVYRLTRWALSAAAVLLIGAGLWMHFAQKRPVATGPNPNYQRGGMGGVPESFVRENAGLFQSMPENIPANGPVKMILRRPVGVTTQPGVRILNWNQLTPQQQQTVRRRAVIFLRLSPQQQVRLLRAHERALQKAKLQRRMSWLRTVLESFTPEEHAKLLRMTPARRGEMFLRRRNELIHAGKLPAVPDATNTNTKTSPFPASLLRPSPSEP